MSTALNCRPSLLFPKGESKDNDYTTEGTIAHELIEKAGVSGKSPEEVATEEHDEEMIRDANLFLDEVRKITEAHPDTEVFFETRLIHSKIPEFGGTIDCLIVSDKTIWILDFKFGAGLTVEVAENPQLLCYAILALDHFGKRTVNLTVIQPRKPHSLGPVRHWRPTYAMISQFANGRLIPLIQWYREATEPQDYLDDFSPTEDNCRFCHAKAECPALRIAAQKAQLMAGQDPSEDYISWLLEHEAVIRKHIEAVKEKAESVLTSGGSVKGYKLVTKYGNRRFTCDRSELEELIADYDVPVVNTSEKMISPAQLEKKVPLSVFQHLIESPETGTKVVKASAFGQDLNDTAAFEEAINAV